jgi:hypothetical protein
MRGQVEFIAILGVIIIAIVAIYFAATGGFQPTEVPVAIQGKYQDLETSVHAMMRSAAYDTMEKISANGGYLSPPADSVKFLGRDVPYWQKNGVIKTPDIKSNFMEGIKEYITENKDSFISSEGGVVVGNPSVSAKFFDSKIDLSVNMPTTIDNYPIPQPYKVTILTKFGDVIDFSEKFVYEEKQERFFEYFTLSSMLMSPIENDQQTVPMLIFLTDCGDYVFKSWWDVQPSMEERIKTTLAHTYMPGKSPLNIGDKTSYPKYSLTPMNGKRYEDIEVTFHLPDDFELKQTNFQFTPNPVIAIAKPVGFTGICTSDPEYVNYHVQFPKISSVKDPLTGNILRFASDVYIKDNAPGEWNAQDGYSLELQAEVCSQPACPANIKVIDVMGNPVQHATVTFMGCDMGKTDSAGSLKADAPCGVGPLQVYRDGYSIYGESKDYSELTDAEVYLFKIVSPRLLFYEAEITNKTISNEYWVDDVDLIENKTVFLTLRSLTFPEDIEKMYFRVFNSPADVLRDIPTDVYIASGLLMDNALTTVYGGFTTVVMLTDDTDELNVYLPTTTEFTKLTDQNQIQFATIILSSVLDNCDIGPVSQTPADTDQLPCIKKYEEV